MMYRWGFRCFCDKKNLLSQEKVEVSGTDYYKTRSSIEVATPMDDLMRLIAGYFRKNLTLSVVFCPMSLAT